MFHGLKRAINIRKPSQATTDPEYDELVPQFTNIRKNAKNLKLAIAESTAGWDLVVAKMQNVAAATTRGVAEAAAQEMAADVTSSVEAFSASRGTIKESSFLPAADKLLTDYIAFLKSVHGLVEKREQLVKDVDYYKSKVDDLEKKGAKVEEKAGRAKEELEKAEDEYTQHNAVTVAALRKAIEMRDSIFARASLAFWDYQNQLLSTAAFQNNVAENDAVLRDWPGDDSFALPSVSDVPVTHRPSSTSTGGGDLNVPPKPAPRRSQETVKYVRAVYDFDAQDAGEISLREGSRAQFLDALEGNEWYKVRFENQEGIVPANYVEFCKWNPIRCD